MGSIFFKKQSKSALLHWYIFTGVTLFALFLLFYFGLIQKMVASDRTYISFIIAILYVLSSIHCYLRLFKLEQETEAAQALSGFIIDAPSLVDKVEHFPPGLVASHVQSLVQKSRYQGGGRLDQGLLLKGLAERIRGSNHIGLFAGDMLLKLGLLGTVVGFIMMLAPIAGLNADNQGEIKSAMAVMSDGMGVAMYTTLAGLAGSILLRLQYYLVDEATARLFSFALELTEVRVISLLEGSRG